jgi:hypothetical protein
MKKAIAITLALVMVVLFAGCGLQSQLARTAWELIEKEGAVETISIFSFELGNVYKEEVRCYVNGVLSSDANETYSNEGKWAVDGEELTITYEDGYVFVCRAVIEGDTLDLIQEKNGVTYKLTLTRIKK